jgi:hypothetical protein
VLVWATRALDSISARLGLGQGAQVGAARAVQYMGMRLPMGMCTGTNWALTKRAT